MTLRAITYHELECDGCHTVLDLGAGLDESAVLPTPPGWVINVYHDYCEACAPNHCAAASAPSRHGSPSSASRAALVAGRLAEVAEVER